MTEVTEGRPQGEPQLSAADEQVLRELTERARTGGLKLTGEGGLLGRLTKMVIEGALEGELRYGPPGPGPPSRSPRTARPEGRAVPGPVVIAGAPPRTPSQGARLAARAANLCGGPDEPGPPHIARRTDHPALRQAGRATASIGWTSIGDTREQSEHVRPGTDRCDTTLGAPGSPQAFGRGQ